MANELNAPLGISNTGLTVLGRVRASGGVQEGSDATMTETGITGFYSGSFALGAVSDGEYSVEFIDTASGNLVGAGELSVKNNAEYELHDQNDFDPATEAVSNVTLVATTTTNTDMRGTDGANTTTPNTIAPDNASITSILADTNELQLNQGDWATATTTISSNMRGTDGANTIVPNTIAPDNASITANGVAVAALNDFNPSVDTVSLVDTVTNLTNAPSGGTTPAAIWSFVGRSLDTAVETDVASRTASQAVGFATEINATANKDEVITVIGNIEGISETDFHDYQDSYVNKADYKATGFNTVIPDNVSISSILVDTNELQSNQTDISLLATEANATINKDEVISNAGLTVDESSKLTDIHDVNLGDQSTESNQFIIKRVSGAVLKTFNLFDDNGFATTSGAFKREEV